MVIMVCVDERPLLEAKDWTARLQTGQAKSEVGAAVPPVAMTRNRKRHDVFSRYGIGNVARGALGWP